MIPEIKFLRAPATDGGAGSGATLPQAGFIFESAANNGQVPPDAEDVEKALKRFRPLYRRLGVCKPKADEIVDHLKNGFDAFDDGDLPVDFLRNGGFHGGDRIVQAKTGKHIMEVCQAMEEAVDRLG